MAPLALAQTSPQRIALQGRIVNADEIPVEAVAVIFTLQIRSPGVEDCLLYEETQNLNMVNSDGFFSISLGAGQRGGTLAFKDTSTLAQALSNHSGALTSLTCASGTSYTPLSTHKRNLRIKFDDGSPAGLQTVDQDMPIEAVPYALYADTLQGKTPSQFIQTDPSLESATPGLTQSRFIDVVSTRFAELDQLLSGTSSAFVRPDANVSFSGTVSFTQVPTYSGAVTSGTQLVTKNYCDAKIGGLSADSSVSSLGAADSGKVLGWDGAKWVAQTTTATDATKLPLSGGTMSGAIDMNGSNLLGTGHVTMSAQRTIHLGTYTNAQEATLTSALGAIDKGKIWFNSESTQLKFWNGTSAQVVGLDFNGDLPVASGANLTDLSADKISSGTLPAARLPAFTGDVTSSAGSNSLTLGTVPLTKGGTGLSAGGASNQVLGMNNAGTVAEYKAITAGTGVTVTHSAGGIEIAASGSGGTVTSVDVAVPAYMTTSGGPITGSGTVTLGFGSQTAKQVFAAPQGANGAPTFRNLEIDAVFSSIGGLSFLNTTPACSSGRALVYVSATDRMECADLTLTSSQVTTALGFTPISNALNSGAILVGNGSNAATAVAMSGDATLANTGALTLANSGVTANTYTKVTVDAKGRVTSGANLAASDVTTALTYTPINKAGDAMSGTLGLAQLAADPDTTGWNNTQKGFTWFNTSTNQVKYWDGSAAQALGISGAGLTSLNGATGSTQTFATGTSGTAPAFSTASDTHTLNIPMASVAGVTAGLLSKTDYDAFAAKQASLGFTPLDRAGSNAMTANLSLSPDGGTTKYNILNLAEPTQAHHAATKNYTDSTLGGSSLDLTGLLNGHTVVWNSGTSKWTPAATTTGTVTGITAGTGLSGGTINTSGTIAIADAGVGTTQIATGAVTTPKIFANPGINRLVATDATTGSTLVPFSCANGETLKWHLTNGWECTAASALPAAAGTAAAPGYTFVGDTDTGIFAAAANQLGLSTGGVEHVRIDSAGKVGIGTSSPFDEVVVYGIANDSSDLTVATPGTSDQQQAVLNLHSKSDGAEIGTATNKGWQVLARGDAFNFTNQQNDLGFSYWNGSSWRDVVFIDSQTGNFGIGTTSPTAGLHVGTSGAASTPAGRLDGNWFVSGTATTTKPHFLIEPSATASTAWSTAGTGLGVNAPSGFSGNLVDFQLNGVSQFKVDSTGKITGDGSGLSNIGGSNMASNATMRTCIILIGADNGPVLADADIAPQGQQCYIPAAATIVEINVRADGGAPNVLLQRRRGAATVADITSAALATATAGGAACAKPSVSQACLDGTTSSGTVTLSNTSLSPGDWIETKTATAGGTAKRISIAVVYRIN